MKKVTLASGAGYWGEPNHLTQNLVEKGDFKYLGLDYLAELTISLLQRQKLKNPTRGYVPQLTEVLPMILTTCIEKGIKIITNGGGTNPLQASEKAVKIAEEQGVSIKIGVIEGDDIRDKIDDMSNRGIEFVNLDTGEKDINKIKDEIVTANAYIGSDLIIEALRKNVDMVIGGRIADNALYVGPIMYELGLSFENPNDWNKIGAAITVGHIIECAEWCCGGNSNFWMDNDPSTNLFNMGLPIVEFYENGEAIISKTPDSGGQMTVNTVREHLVYEVHNPKKYLMPDGVADFTTLKLEQVGKDRVKVTNMSGTKRPDTLKVQIGYEDGYIAESTLLVPWPQAVTKAKFYQKIANDLFETLGFSPDQVRYDWIGINSAHGVVAPIPEDEDTVNEIMLRFSAHVDTRMEAEIARGGMGGLIIGPVGTGFGRPVHPREVISLWPTLVPREEVKTTLRIKEVK